MPTHSAYEKEVSLQTNCRKSAVEFVKIVNDLWYDDAIELVIFRNQLIDKKVNEILRLHDYAKAFLSTNPYPFLMLWKSQKPSKTSASPLQN